MLFKTKGTPMGNNVNRINKKDENNAIIKKAFVELLAEKFLTTTVKNKSMAIAEKEMVKNAMKVVNEAMVKGIESLDDLVLKNKPNNFVSKAKDERVIDTLAGCVQFKRRRFVDKNTSKSVYLLDKSIGILKSAKLSPAFSNLITANATKTSYRSAIYTQKFYSGNNITAPTVQKSVENTAKKIQNSIDERKTEINKNIDINEEKIKTNTLMAESDGVYIHVQRPKGSNKSKVKKMGKNVDVFKVYEGKKGNKTQNPKVYACMTNDKDKFKDDVYAGLLSKYDYDNVKESYISTDGEKKYKNLKDIMPNTPKCKTVHILDKWHILNALNVFKHRYCKLKPLVLKCIYDENNIYKAISIIQMYIKREKISSWKTKLNNLISYFISNKSSINKDFPSLGTMESTNAHVIGARMKNYGGGWSIKGANNMSICLSEMTNTNGNLPFLTDKQESIELELAKSIPKYLSVKKSLKLGDNTSEHTIPEVSFSGTREVTNNFIRRMMGDI
jgi:hypothetical protein